MKGIYGLTYPAKWCYPRDEALSHVPLNMVFLRIVHATLSEHLRLSASGPSTSLSYLNLQLSRKK